MAARRRRRREAARAQGPVVRRGGGPLRAALPAPPSVDVGVPAATMRGDALSSMRVKRTSPGRAATAASTAAESPRADASSRAWPAAASRPLREFPIVYHRASAAPDVCLPPRDRGVRVGADTERLTPSTSSDSVRRGSMMLPRLCAVLIGRVAAAVGATTASASRAAQQYQTGDAAPRGSFELPDARWGCHRRWQAAQAHRRRQRKR